MDAADNLLKEIARGMVVQAHENEIRVAIEDLQRLIGIVEPPAATDDALRDLFEEVLVLIPQGRRALWAAELSVARSRLEDGMLRDAARHVHQLVEMYNDLPGLDPSRVVAP